LPNAVSAKMNCGKRGLFAGRRALTIFPVGFSSHLAKNKSEDRFSIRLIQEKNMTKVMKSKGANRE
jgi:hypothetical protein